MKRPSFYKRLIRLPILLLLLVVLPGTPTALAEKTPLITSADALTAALMHAEDGDTVLVGDIDFTPPQGLTKALMRISITKSVTIACGKKDGKAVFTGAGFLLQGGKAETGRIACRFENIVFDGNVNAKLLAESDWEYPTDENGEPTGNEPPLAGSAAVLRGNADATFRGCVFRSYMNEQGGAINCFYGDYTASPELMALLGDNSACSAAVEVTDCQFTGNASLYGGGAFYAEGNGKNVSFTAKDCVFAENLSGCHAFSMGGGAICVSDAAVTLCGCDFSENVADHPYGKSLPDYEAVPGGAAAAINCLLEVTDCRFCGNRASVGGGLSVVSTETVIDGCSFTDNRAAPEISDPAQAAGPWSNMGLGGGIAVQAVNPYTLAVCNSSFYRNSALNGYGAVYAFYNEEYVNTLPHGFGRVSFSFCTFADNVTERQYDDGDPEKRLWLSHPGNFWEIPYVEAACCLVSDPLFEAVFPVHALPTAENGYNYLACPEMLREDGLTLSPDRTGYLSAQGNRIILHAAPGDAVRRIAEGHYCRPVGSAALGCCYSGSLYRGKCSGTPRIALWCAGGILLLTVCGFAAFIAIRKKKAVPEVPENAFLLPQEERSEPSLLPEDWIDRVCQKPEIAGLLSRRETEVLHQLLEGKSRREIAAELFVTEATIRKHSTSIYAKLAVHNRTELLYKLTRLP